MQWIFGDEVYELDEYDFSKGKRFSYTLALELNKIVHDLCRNVPHDIGMALAIAVSNHITNHDRDVPSDFGKESDFINPVSEWQDKGVYGK